MFNRRVTAHHYRVAFDHIEELLAGLGLVALALLSVRDTSPLATAIELATIAIAWGAFCLAFVVRLVRSGGDRRRRFGSWVDWFDAAAVVLPAGGLAAGLDRRDAALLCGVWIVKFARNTKMFRLLGRVLANEGRNLASVALVFAMVIFAVALGTYVLERDSQPATFGSIPAAIWWAVTTMTTTGYGDAVPQSAGGRLLAGAAMTAGIGLFALWAGILAAGFSKEVRRHDFLRNWALVARVPLFATLAAAELAEITQLLRPRTVRAGAVICRKGDPGEQMYFIVDGAVDVATAPPVRLGAGDYFGELALLTHAPRSATITAATETALLVLDVSDFRVLMGRSPALATAIQTEAERRLAAFGQAPGKSA